MKKLMIVAAVALGIVVETRSESAAWQNETEMTKEWPVGIGIVVPAQFPPVRHDVCGFRFGGLLGWNETVRGLDLGLGNVATDNEYGLQLGGVNAVWGDFAGLQAGCFNYNASISAGAQFGVLNWDSLSAYGFLLGAVNTNLRSLDGIAFGGVNFAGAQDEPLGLFQRFQRAQGQLLARACAQGDDGYLMHDGFNPFSALRGGAGGQADPRCARP